MMFSALVNAHKRRFLLAALRAKSVLIRRSPGIVPFYLRLYGGTPAVTLWQRLSGGPQPISFVSYPCSGRTWIDNMVADVIRAGVSRSFPSSFTTFDLSARLRDIPTIRFTHAGSSWETHYRTASEYTECDTTSITGRRFLFLWRDPRDTLVSVYHHAKYRSMLADLRREEMLSNPVIGIDKLVTFLNHWQRAINGQRAGVLVIRYEELLRDPLQGLRSICRSIDIPASEHDLERAIRQNRFAKMHAAERSGQARNPRLASIDTKNGNSFKARKGQPGEYLQFFTSSQVTRLDQILKNTLNRSMREILYPTAGTFQRRDNPRDVTCI